MTGKAAVVGTFDGMHLGHAAVISTLKEEAEKRGLEPMVITFDRHPLALIAPERAPSAIISQARKEEILRKERVKTLVLPFDEKMRATTAAQWIDHLHDDLDVRLLVLGYDTTFGSDGLAYSIADYKRMGRAKGIEVEEAPFVAGISSSAIRKAIAAGEVDRAAEMLGRNFTLSGTVVAGNRLGRTIGFPTANIIPAPGIVLPGDGVYAVKATLPDGKTCDAMVNIGVRPTIRRGDDRTVEAHIIGWEGDLYGKQVKLSFRKRLRDECRFNSIDALRRQLEKDREDAIAANNIKKS